MREIGQMSARGQCKWGCGKEKIAFCKNKPWQRGREEGWVVTWKELCRQVMGHLPCRKLHGVGLGLEHQITSVFWQVAVGPHRKPFNPWYL